MDIYQPYDQTHCTSPILADRCSQPKAPGPCVSYMTRWFYNTETGSCETFVYGGCEGNRNKFLTQEECEGECITESSPQTPSPMPATPSPEVKTQDGKITHHLKTRLLYLFHLGSDDVSSYNFKAYFNPCL